MFLFVTLIIYSWLCWHIENSFLYQNSLYWQCAMFHSLASCKSSAHSKVWSYILHTVSCLHISS